jgi:aminomethyltransferase
LLILTSRGAQVLVSNWLRKHIFFNDDVQVRDASGEFGMLSVYGPGAADVASALTGQEARGLALHAWQSGRDDVIVARADPIAGDGYHLLVTAPDSLRAMWRAALDSGATPMGEQAFEILRIEAGLPRFARELSEAYIPLEVGLWSDVSFSKGCYTGQEIIARMESRHKLAKQLVGVRSSASLMPGAELRAEGSGVGQVTSSAVRPDGQWIALAVVKPAYAAPSTRLTLNAEQPGEVEVVALPM